MSKKKIVILGSTGSIGTNAVRIAEHLPDSIEVFGIAAGTNFKALAHQAAELHCRYSVIGQEADLSELKRLLPNDCQALAGREGIIELVTHPEVDMVLCCIVGTDGLLPVLEAIKAKKDIAIASKEVLVMAGELVMAEVAENNVNFLPVDSEHSAIFQCLEGKNHNDVGKIILTASGGPFKNACFEEIKNATYDSALSHPTWAMGPKVTIDSATLMNKALEIIEAHWLFAVSGQQIEVLIHPQSIVHSMVEFIDGTILAQMNIPDMRLAIQYALTYPERHSGSLDSLNFAEIEPLTFEKPNSDIFPSLGFAYHALERGGTMPAVMNAANEVAVKYFRSGKIKITDIWDIIEKVMSSHDVIAHPNLDSIFMADKWARENVENRVKCL